MMRLSSAIVLIVCKLILQSKAIILVNTWSDESKKSTALLAVATNSKHNKLIYPNLLDQKFDANYPNESWVSDITYIWTNEGWLYLAGVKDLYTKGLVGYVIHKRMTADLISLALNMAIKSKRFSQGLILHSDRGSQ